MPRVTVDFSQIEDFEPVPKDTYPVLVSNALYTEAASEDKFDYITLELKISEGEFEGRMLWDRMSLSPKALWRTKQTLENLGVFDEDLNIDYDDESMVVTEPELIGLPAMADVSVGKYEGRNVNNVDALLAADTAKRGTKRAASSGARKSRPTAKKKTGTRKFQ